MIERLKRQARRLKQELVALYLASRDPRTPLYAKVFAGVVVAYTLSPFDLIPDFIPILGYLDDLLLVPLGIWIAIRLIPAAVLEESRARAAEIERLSVNWVSGAAMILVWFAAAALVAVWAVGAFLR